MSPPLRWSGAPPGTKSFALIAYDPDAPGGTFVHWVLYDIPAGRAELPEAVPRSERVEGVGLQGLNDFGRVGYGGPCPPPGHGPHRYFILALALERAPRLPPGFTLEQLLGAARGRVVAWGYAVGVYERG